MEYRPFKDARMFVHTLGLKSREEWKKYYKSGKMSADIPLSPESIYKNEWKGWGDWLGSGNIAHSDRKFRPFPEARKFVHSLQLKNTTEWKGYYKSRNRPKDIPANPVRTYRKEWKGYGDWLGTGFVACSKREYRSFAEARKLVRSLGILSQRKWRVYCKSGKKPEDLPSNPVQVYEKEWTTWGDWFGTGRIADQYKKYQSFPEARKFVRSLRLRSSKEWDRYSKSGSKPDSLPADPQSHYKRGKQWTSWGDFLGTDYVAGQYRTYRPFVEARKFVHSLGFKSRKEWEDYRKSGKMSKDLPSLPSSNYKKNWKGWGDWLGTYYIAHQNREYKSFEEARNFMHSLDLKSYEEWKDYLKSGKKPKDIPSSPVKVYEKEWTDWRDWLGYEAPFWSVNNVKELLRNLIESKIIYQWNEAVLYSFLLRKGVLNLHENRHEQFVGTGLVY